MNSGHWIIKTDMLGRIWECHCSICNGDPLDYICGTEDWWLCKLPNYCPTCGENMIIDDNKENINKSSIQKLDDAINEINNMLLQGGNKMSREVKIDYKDSRNVQLYKYLETLYHTLRENKHRNLELFNSNKYKWKLGVEIANILNILDNQVVTQEKTRYLFGIEVEIDYKNPYNVQLYEDITNQIAIELETDQK